MNLAGKTITYGVFRQSILTLVALGSIASAQPVKHVYHPDDVLRISVTFEGPDASKIHSAAFDIRILESAKDQPSFATDLYAQDSKPTGPNTFEVSIKIPKNQASGDYKLVMVRGFVVDPNPSIMLQYNAPGDFKERTYTIENPERFVKPTIKDIKEP